MDSLHFHLEYSLLLRWLLKSTCDSCSKVPEKVRVAHDFARQQAAPRAVARTYFFQQT